MTSAAYIFGRSWKSSKNKTRHSVPSRHRKNRRPQEGNHGGNPTPQSLRPAKFRSPQGKAKMWQKSDAKIFETKTDGETQHRFFATNAFSNKGPVMSQSFLSIRYT